jgi:hypothetical protein
MSEVHITKLTQHFFAERQSFSVQDLSGLVVAVVDLEEEGRVHRSAFGWVCCKRLR